MIFAGQHHHLTFQIVSGVSEIWTLAEFLHFFFLFFLHFIKVWKLSQNTKALSDCLEIRYTDRAHRVGKNSGPRTREPTGTAGMQSYNSGILIATFVDTTNYYYYHYHYYYYYCYLWVVGCIKIYWAVCYTTSFCRLHNCTLFHKHQTLAKMVAK